MKIILLKVSQRINTTENKTSDKEVRLMKRNHTKWSQNSKKLKTITEKVLVWKLDNRSNIHIICISKKENIKIK